MTLILDILILFIMPFIMLGIIKKTKAFWGGRKGASIFQPLYDVLRLMKKESIYSETTSLIFKLSPIVNFSVVIFASLFVPLINGYSILNIPFAFIIFSYILGFAKFFSLIASLDMGSSFEGMGASREACFSTIVEPAFFISMASIIALTKVTSFEALKMILQNSGIYGILITILTVVTLFIMLLIEGCRVPVDDPATHLELTMIHEVMILDNSGADLGFILWASAIKMFLFGALITSLIIPDNLPVWISCLLFILSISLLAFIIGTIESSIARFRMTHIFEFIFIMSIMALLILTLVTYRIYGN